MELYGYIITLAGISFIPLAAAQNLAALLGSLGGLGFGGDGPSFNMQMGGGGGGGNSNCPYQAHPDRFKFTQIVNNRQMTQNCAPGTLFDVSKCSCVNAPKTSPGGGPMPGSNPRLEASFGGFGGGGGGGGGSGDISQLLGMLQQLQGGGGGGGGAPILQQQRRQPSPTPMFRPTQRPQINTRAPEQNLQGGLSLDLQLPGNGQWANPIKYNPGLGLVPVVDPTILPDVLPPAVLDALKKATRPPVQTKAPTRPTAKPTIPQSTKPGQLQATKPGQLPANVIDMLNRASSPPSQRPSSKTTKKPAKQNGTKMVGATSLPNKSTNKPAAGSLPPNVLRMLQQANSAAKPNSPRPTSIPMPTKRPTAPRPTGPQIPAGGDPMAALLAQLQAHMAKNSQPSAPVPTQSDPMASLMSRIQQPSRQPTKRPSGGAPDLSQLAGLLGGSGGLMGGSGGPDLASLFGSLGNPQGNAGGNMGGNMGGNSPSAPGGMLDFNSLSGNLNVAALMGETPGPSLGQNLDMTSFFNTQGKMGAGGGLAGLQNLNIAKLQQLDRQGVIDISDLSPAGLAAANAHFG